MFTMMLTLGIFAALALAMATGPQLRDALLKLTRALPASTATVTSTAVDTEVSTRGIQGSSVGELLLTAPALTTGQLPDGKTMTYSVIMSNNSDLSSPTTLYSAAIVQTGAAGAGAVGATERVKLPSNTLRYVGFTITPSASGTGDASATSGTLEFMF